MAVDAETDRRWMRRCLRLGLRSLGRTWPNPGVACLLVRDGREIGAGRHLACGGPHGEIEALHDCTARGLDARGATAYVSLAPCTRHGRTPPCTDALIEAGVARVVVGVEDPAQDDAARRFAAAGIDYSSGVCGDEASALHGGFLTRISRGRPRVTGKWAMTLDGFLACAGGHSNWISSAANLALSRRRRRLYDAILVGGGTARADNPSLLSLHRDERTPLRVVLSGSGDLGPAPRALLATVDRYPVLVVHDHRCPAERQRALIDQGVGLLAVADVGDAPAVAQALGDHGLNDLLVEGGAQIHGAWLRAGLYDRLEVAISARTIAGGLPVAAGCGVERIDLGTEWVAEVPPRVQGQTCAWRLRREGVAPSLPA